MERAIGRFFEPINVGNFFCPGQPVQIPKMSVRAGQAFSSKWVSAGHDPLYLSACLGLLAGSDLAWRVFLQWVEVALWATKMTGQGSPKASKRCPKPYVQQDI